MILKHLQSIVEKRKTGEHLAAKVVSFRTFSNFILLGKSSKASETYYAILGEQVNS